MAATRIMSIHNSKGKTPRQSITDRLDYIMNSEKTDGGVLISSNACMPETAADEFMLYRQEYIQRTGREINNEVLAYHVRQSFKPGEITPEKANEIGMALAQRMTGDNYAFVVATHTDRRHIHNHIMICATALDGEHKYRDVKCFAKDLAQLSDQLCRENGLSVIEYPQEKSVTYDKWQGDQKQLSHRDFLRMAIDTALKMQPDGFDALMQMLEELGCRIKHSAHISIRPPEGKRFIRLDSLGAEYTEASLRKVLDGHHVHIPKIPQADYTRAQVGCLIDIEQKLREGKGRGYAVWAELTNIDTKAQSVIFLKENHIESYEELEARIESLRSKRNSVNASIRKKQNRMKEINRQRKAIRDYGRTKEVYEKYRESGWSPKFYNAHRQEIEDHKNAQAVYAAINGKMPSLKELAAEYDDLRTQLQNEKTELEKIKPQLTTLGHVKYNFDIISRDHLPDSHDLDRSQQVER